MWRIAVILGVFLILAHCASPPKHKAYPVLEPMESPLPAEKVEAPRPNYEKLANLLLSLGYEPVGMQFESDANLDLLYQVFSSPIAQRRKIKLVYTGLQMQYDKIAESFTVGGLTNVISILSYIQRNVPINTGVPSPTPVHNYAPSPTPVPSATPSTLAPPIFQEEEIPNN